MVEVNLDEDFYKAFRKLLEALRSYNKEIVVIGGLANALYEYHDLGKKSPLDTIATKDLDVLVSKKVTVIDEKIVKKLEEEGFKIEPVAANDKVITKFRYEDSNFEIEFLCPKYGADPLRGKDQMVTEVQEGLTAQPLRYLDLALFNTWSVSSELIPSLAGMNLDIQIPSAGAYLIQKFIIRNDVNRIRYNQKDAFYTYELLLKFTDNLQSVAESVGEVELFNLKKGNYKKVKNFRRDFAEYYGSKNAEGIQKVFKEVKQRGIKGITEEDITYLFNEFIALIPFQKK